MMVGFESCEMGEVKFHCFALVDRLLCYMKAGHRVTMPVFELWMSVRYYNWR